MTDLSQLTPDQLAALNAQLASQPPAPAQTGSGDPSAAAPGSGIVYGQGAPVTSAPVTQGQATYRASTPTDPKAPAGTPLNPYYDWQGGQAPANADHVNMQGQLVDPNAGKIDVLKLSPADLKKLDDHLASFSPAEDASRSAPSGLREGVSGVLGLPGSAANTWGDSVDTAASALGQALGIFTPQQVAAQQAAPPENYAHTVGLVDDKDVMAADQKLLGPYHVPQTFLGRMGETAGQILPWSLGGEASAPVKLGNYLASVAGATAASELAPDNLKGVAKMAGGVGAGRLLDVGRNIVDAPQIAVGRTLSSVSPDDIQAAAQLGRDAAARGIRLTPMEALAQVSPEAQTGRNLQHFVENSIPGRERMAPWMAQRPGQVDQAVRSFADTIAPAHPNPSMLGVDAQGLAQGLLDRSAAYRTQSVNPFYEQANPQTVAPDAMDDLFSRINQHAASDKTGILAQPLNDLLDKLTDEEATAQARQAHIAANTQQMVSVGGQQVPLNSLSPAAQQAVQRAGAPITSKIDPSVQEEAAQIRAPITDIENLDRVRKYVRDNTQAQIDRGRMTPEQGAALTGYLFNLDSIMESASPDFVKGKQLYGQMSDQYVTPLTAGPLGKIAGTSDVGAQTRALYPSAPLEGASNETDQAARLMARDPTASEPIGGRFPENMDDTLLGALTRQHIMNTYGQSAQDLVGGENQYGGAKWAAEVAGNPEQAAALRAGLAAANSKAPDDFDNLIQALQATGKRMPAGSLTAFNEEMRERLGASPAPIRTLGAILDPLEIGKHIDHAVGGALYRRQINGIADLLQSDPDAWEASIQAARAASKRGLMQGLTPAVGSQNRQP